MISTILVIGGAALAGLGGIATVTGNVLKSKEDQQAKKDMIDYEYEMLGRRDENNDKN